MLLLAGVPAVPGWVGAGVVFAVGGVLVLVVGLLGWAQRSTAHLLVAANAAAAGSSGGEGAAAAGVVSEDEGPPAGAGGR